MLKVIRTFEDLNLLVEYVKPLEYIAFDTETTGLTKRHEVIGISICAEEDKAFYIILAEWNKVLQKLIYNEHIKNDILELLNVLKTKQLIAHNAVFDCMMIEAYFGIRLIDSIHTDTMILAHLLDENRRVGLKDLASSMYGESSIEESKLMKASIIANGGKVTKDEFELYKADSELIGKYGAKDALLTYKLFTDLVPELHLQSLDKFFYEDESMPLLKGPTYDLNTTGLRVDQQAVISLKKTLEAECAEAKVFIYQEIAPYIKDKEKFNVEAPQQLSWLLFGELNLEFGYLTKVGKTVCKAIGLKIPYTAKAKRDFIDICIRDQGRPYIMGCTHNEKEVKPKLIRAPWAYIAADKNTLKKLATRFKWIDRLLEYKRKMKLLSTYVSAIEERTQYGVLQPSFLMHGTTSGRYSSRNPNLQNLPRDDERIKECFIARPGKVFVSADYSQLEPRVFSYYSQDPRLMRAFDGSDFYSVIGIEVFDKHDALPLKEGHPNAFGVKYKQLRDVSKTIALAYAYGATAHQLAPATGKSIDDTAEDLANLSERFPGIKNMMLEAHELAKTQGYVTNIFGRKRRIPEAMNITKIYKNQAHHDLPYEARSLLNLACNFRIQSTGASIVNRGMIAFYNNIKELGLNAKIVSQIHDEVVVECDKKDCETVTLLLQNCLESTTILKDMPLEAIPRVTTTLAKSSEKHDKITSLASGFKTSD
jgi:DNA polymerase I